MFTRIVQRKQCQCYQEQFYIVMKMNLTVQNVMIIFMFQIDAAKQTSGANTEGVLANFFNSLLHKKTGAGSPAVKPTGKKQFKTITFFSSFDILELHVNSYFSHFC